MTKLFDELEAHSLAMVWEDHHAYRYYSSDCGVHPHFARTSIGPDDT
jgi:hypothetical protein